MEMPLISVSWISWNTFMDLGALLFVGIAVVIYVYHQFQVLRIKEYKDKYDYVNEHEIRHFWYSVLALIVAAALYSNSLMTRLFDIKGVLQTYLRIFYTAGFCVVAYFILSSIVKVVYPRVVEKRLTRLRNAPRTSPSGNKMRKLSEEEEDAHLEASQIAEEASSVHSVDYDVWLDEKTGFKRIEKYMNYLQTEQCPECGFYTMKIFNEEVAKEPTLENTGILAKHYRCSYCNHREIREATIAKLSTNVA